MNTVTPAWEVFGGSATGAHKHVNQDRHACQSLDDGTGLVLAVADGHGSAAHPRSDIGAELAVSTFLEAAASFHASIKPGEHGRVKTRAEGDFPRNVVRAWQDRVKAHMDENPDDGPDRGGPPAVLYGTTLIGALITSALVIGWQLGDGDLCFIETDGRITTPLRRKGTDDLGDETDSLCSANAHVLMRTCWRRDDGTDGPVLVALSTDGLSKSFVSHDSYEEFLSGLHGRLRTDGTTQVQEEIPGWLRKASSFSGDDATLVVAWREQH